MNKLILEKRLSFDIFKSEIRHIYKSLGTYNFINEIITNNWVELFWEKKWFPESFYTLAMLDYLSDINEVPYYSKYDVYRQLKLSEPIFPTDIIYTKKLNSNNNSQDIFQEIIKQCKEDKCGKYFYKYNIIERSITDVV